MRAAGLLLLAACGRIGFDATTSEDGGADAPPVTPFMQEVDTNRSRVEDLALLPGGGVVIAGNVNPDSMLAGVPIPNAGNNDALVAAFEPDGTLRWVRGFGGPNTDFVRGVAVAPDGTIFLAGEADPGAMFDDIAFDSDDHDGFLASLTADGDVRWVEPLTDTANGTDSATFVQVAADGDVIVGGADDSTAFVARYSPAGGIRWTTYFGGDTGVSRVWAAAIVGDTIYVTGGTEGDVPFPDGNHPGFGSQDGFVAALDGASGALLWGDLWGGSEDERGADVIAFDDRVLVIGYYAAEIDLAVPAPVGQDDMLFATWSTEGDRIGARSLGTAGCDQGQGLRAVNATTARFSGNFGGTLTIDGQTLEANGVDGLVGLVTADLEISALRGFGGAGDDTVYAVDGEYVGGALADAYEDSTCGSTFVGRGFVSRVAD